MKPVRLLPLLALVLGACGSDDDDNGGNGGDGGAPNGDGMPPVVPTPSLDPAAVPKFAQALVVPPVMPPSQTSAELTEYRIAVRQFRQQVLPPPLPETTVWGYGVDGNPATFSYPGYTVETRSNAPVRVTWINQLVDDSGAYLPHLLPVDSTIHWANPGGEATGHAHTGSALYTGPVPITTHVHGAHSFDHSDGHPESWFLPDATNIPANFAARGPAYQSQSEVGPGQAVFDYPQDEAAATLWYHDHVLGMTRVNIHAGLAGFWLIRDAAEDALNLPGPAPKLGDPAGTRYYEIPIVIQDSTFASDGSLSYPSSRAMYDGYPGPYIPDSEVPPIWGPEFIGNVIVVNGRVWPYLEVEPRLYRFRVMNASDARTLILSFEDSDLEFTQVGTEAGWQPGAPLQRSQLLIGPAERYDVIVDFSSLAPGDTVTLANLGPDDPWGGPHPSDPQNPADPETTGQVMQFRVVELTSDGNPGTIPASLPARVVPESQVSPRDLLLAEADDPSGTYPTHDNLGTVALGPLPWEAPVSEVIQLNDTEIWRIANTTDDAHPIHVHLVDFLVLDRVPFDVDAFQSALSAWLAGTGPEPRLDDFVDGSAQPPEPGELGEKDTVLMWPGTITRIVATYDRAGNYVWHCHIIEHEDNEMMRPFEVVAPP